MCKKISILLMLYFAMFFTEQGSIYEFRVLAKNENDYGVRAVVELETPDGGKSESPIKSNTLVLNFSRTRDS